MSQLPTRTFRRGQVLYRAGDHEPFLYHLVSGRVAIYARYGQPDQKLLTVLDAARGDTSLGEAGALDGSPRSADAVAETDCVVEAVSPERLRFYAEERPAEVLAMVLKQSARLRALTNDYMAVCHSIAQTEDAAASHS